MKSPQKIVDFLTTEHLKRMAKYGATISNISQGMEDCITVEGLEEIGKLAIKIAEERDLLARFVLALREIDFRNKEER